MKDVNVKKGKGILSNLVGKPKKTSCCCGGYEIEEIPEEENDSKKTVTKEAIDKNK